MQRMKATVWRRLAFPNGGAPCSGTINARIKNGDLPGEKLGGLHFIHVYDGTIIPCWSETQKNQSAADIESDAHLRDFLHDTQTA